MTKTPIDFAGADLAGKLSLIKHYLTLANPKKKAYREKHNFSYATVNYYKKRFELDGAGTETDGLSDVTVTSAPLTIAEARAAGKKPAAGNHSPTLDEAIATLEARIQQQTTSLAHLKAVRDAL